MTRGKRTKGPTLIYKTLCKKLKIEQHESHWKQGMNSCALKTRWSESWM